MRDHGRVISFLLVVAAFAISAIAYTHLPASIPVHWGASGTPDQFGSRMRGAFQLPIVMLFTWLFIVFVPRYDRNWFIKYNARDSDSSTARPAYDSVVVAVLAFLLAMHAYAIITSLGFVGASRQPLVIALLVSAGMIVIGNYIPRVTRRNAFIGYRLPWAYASEEVWRRTQRAGGYGMVGAGLVGVAGALVFPQSPMKPLIIALVAQVVVVMIYSYYLAHSSEVP